MINYNTLKGHDVAKAAIGAELLYQGTKAIPGTSHKGTLTGKAWDGTTNILSKATDKIRGISSETKDNPINSTSQSDDTKTDKGIGDEPSKKRINQHSDSLL